MGSLAACYLVSEKIFTNLAGWLVSNLFSGDLSREARWPVVFEIALSMIKKRRNYGVFGEILEGSDPWVAIQIPLRIYCVSRHIFSIINFLTYSQRITGSSASLDIKWDFHHIFEFIIKEKPYFSSD